jgi:hypothetical protein
MEDEFEMKRKKRGDPQILLSMFPAHLFNYFSGFYDKAKSHGN